MKLYNGNQSMVLARKLGWHCGLGEEIQFQYPTVDKAFNEFWPLIKDEARIKGWYLQSKDTIENEFRHGYFDAEKKKQMAEQ